MATSGFQYAFMLNYPMEDEVLEIVNEKGDVVGKARRSEIHGNPSLIHRVVHLLVFNNNGDLLLQKRSLNKDVAPGKWDTSVGGHINPNEDIVNAAKRELHEELGVLSPNNLNFLYSYIHTNPYETELVYTYSCEAEGEFHFNRDEITEVRFFSIAEIKERLGRGALSDNFEHEIAIYLSFLPPIKRG